MKTYKGKGTKPEIMWIIVGVHGIYIDTRHTRKEMIQKHEDDTGLTWKNCRKNGDRAVKALIVPLDEDKK